MVGGFRATQGLLNDSRLRKTCSLLTPKAPCTHIVVFLRPPSTKIGAPLRPKYILYGYMEPLGTSLRVRILYAT